MAHGRNQPDIVLNIRYVNASAIRAVSEHELHRTRDGVSAIDPDRTRLNQILHSTPGPDGAPLRTQQQALDVLLGSGVKGPAAQAEDPYVQLVLSASPLYFRRGGPAGTWSDEHLQVWRDESVRWLREQYGSDLIHASLHLDEDTPHIHALVVPTYEKKARKPGKRAKGETEAEFEARVAAAAARSTIRTIGRSSNDFWSGAFARRRARQAYHKLMEPLGLGYGRDFIGEGEESPEHKTTGEWVREQRLALQAQADALSKEREVVATERQALEVDRLRLDAEQDALRAEVAEHRAYVLRQARDAAEIAAQSVTAVITGRAAPEGPLARLIAPAIQPAIQRLSAWWARYRPLIEALPKPLRPKITDPFSGAAQEPIQPTPGDGPGLG